MFQMRRLPCLELVQPAGHHVKNATDEVFSRSYECFSDPTIEHYYKLAVRFTNTIHFCVCVDRKPNESDVEFIADSFVDLPATPGTSKEFLRFITKKMGKLFESVSKLRSSIATHNMERYAEYYLKL